MKDFAIMTSILLSLQKHPIYASKCCRPRKTLFFLKNIKANNVQITSFMRDTVQNTINFEYLSNILWNKYKTPVHLLFVVSILFRTSRFLHAFSMDCNI